PGRAALRYRFDQARKAAGVDKADSAGDIRQAQAQLGRASVTTTEIYVRKRKGAKTTPNALA
ncbi:integrase, partial [Xanthomonas oryzae pv. oryzae]